MRRLKEDRGAVAILVAVLMVPILICAALVVDIGFGYVQRRQLQNAADAAALAVAQDCGRGSCGNMATTALSLATGNIRTDTLTATPVLKANSVTVTTTAKVIYAFAPVIGIRSQTVTARSTASWAGPNGGTALLPLTISRCSFDAQTKDAAGFPSGTTLRTIYLSKSAGAIGCTPQSGLPVPGGFGWLKTVNASCTAYSTLAADRVDSDPGNSVPSSCANADFTSMLGKTLLLPLFDTTGGTGTGAWYHLYGYAAFRFTSYDFGGQNHAFSAPDTASPCGGNDRCIRGYFLRYVEPSDTFTYGAGGLDLGARIVTLTA